MSNSGLGLRRQLLGEDNPDVATSLNNLAGLYDSQGRYEDAETLYVQAIALFMERLGQKHPNTQTGLKNFMGFIVTVVEAERQDELSDHPATQRFLELIQSQSNTTQQ